MSKYIIIKYTLFLLFFTLISACTENMSSIRRSLSSDFNRSALFQPSPPGYPISDSESELKIASRVYVASTLKSIFGPSVSTEIDQLVTNEIFRFGGPCDAYNPSTCPKGVAVAAGSDLTAYPKSSSGREGLRVKICDQIVQKNSALQYALESIDLWPVTGIPDEEGILQVYQLFFPGKFPSDPIIQALLNVAEETQLKKFDKLEAWRFLFLTLCMVPEWQIL